MLTGNSIWVTLSVTGLKVRLFCSSVFLIVCASAALTHASWLLAVVHCKAATRNCQERRPESLGAGLRLACPLCMIAPRNGTGFGGVVTSLSTDDAPADSPKMVTFFGSPPKEAMLRWTQSNARRWSRKPTFREVRGSSGEFEKPKTVTVRKPKS